MCVHERTKSAVKKTEKHGEKEEAEVEAPAPVSVRCVCVCVRECVCVCGGLVVVEAGPLDWGSVPANGFR